MPLCCTPQPVNRHSRLYLLWPYSSRPPSCFSNRFASLLATIDWHEKYAHTAGRCKLSKNKSIRGKKIFSTRLSLRVPQRLWEDISITFTTDEGKFRQFHSGAVTGRGANHPTWLWDGTFYLLSNPNIVKLPLSERFEGGGDESEEQW